MRNSQDLLFFSRCDLPMKFLGNFNSYRYAGRADGGDWVSVISLAVIAVAILVIVRVLVLWISDAEVKTVDSIALDKSVINIDSSRGSFSGGVEGKGEITPAPFSERLDVGSVDHESANTDSVVSVDLLGVSIQLRELRTENDDPSGGIRNVEFFIRDGIRPKRLFEGSAQVIKNYWPLYHNNVGYGAVTVKILYQFVEQDTNGDGTLSGEDQSSLAVSLPDGSHYRVLDRNIDEVIDMNYLSDYGELRLDVMAKGEVGQRVYSLADG